MFTFKPTQKGKLIKLGMTLPGKMTKGASSGCNIPDGLEGK